MLLDGANMFGQLGVEEGDLMELFMVHALDKYTEFLATVITIPL